uniref:Uncharacterized protein n=1 Tax=Anopheles dirus TaxID=7168 RepID=A0A182NYG3_9DIPT
MKLLLLTLLFAIIAFMGLSTAQQYTPEQIEEFEKICLQHEKPKDCWVTAVPPME